MFHPDMRVSASMAVVVSLAVVLGIYRHNQVAPQSGTIARVKDKAAPAGDLASVLAEARRDIG